MVAYIASFPLWVFVLSLSFLQRCERPLDVLPAVATLQDSQGISHGPLHVLIGLITVFLVPILEVVLFGFGFGDIA